jgi:ribosome biogenesis GTPase / thiamine phosphate phosphatase
MLDRIGLEPSMARAASAADALLGRVVRVDRGTVAVLTDDGLQRASLGGGVLAPMAADPTLAPCTGDWCVLRRWPDHRVTLEQLLPRRTAVVRRVAGRQSHGQVLCANADIVALVVALEPLPRLARVERLVALAWQSGAQPLVVLTKSDLAPDADQVAEDVVEAVPDVEVLVASVRSGRGVDALRERLDGRLTMALLGASGHGKSSLANALVGAQRLPTREIREDGRGRHTTVRRELVPLPAGGAVIDMPGLRGLGLVASGTGLARTFADIEELARDCRFEDCGHDRESGCRVREAVAEGDLPQRRLEAWQHLQRELLWATRRRSEGRRGRVGRDRSWR